MLSTSKRAISIFKFNPVLGTVVTCRLFMLMNCGSELGWFLTVAALGAGNIVTEENTGSLLPVAHNHTTGSGLDHLSTTPVHWLSLMMTLVLCGFEC